MKQAWILTAAALTAGFCVPALTMGLLQRQEPPQPEETQPPVTAAVQLEETLPVSEDSLDGTLLLEVLKPDGSVSQMPLDDYLIGVVLAEMPTSFEPEALKAQAVVSRTYTLRKMGQSKHETADICTDSSCCQGWISYEDYRLKSGEEAGDIGVEKAAQAVRGTDGLVLTYGGSLIDATYFSCSGGRTEAAVEVWGSDVPYLQAVDSPGEDAPRGEDSVTFTREELADLLHSQAPEADLSGLPENWFGEVTATQGGGVETLEIGGVTFTGGELRSLLGLRSTVFAVSVSGDTVIFETKGFGHRVGMSQYGAQAMALEGSTCQEILLHYYSGVELTNYFSS